MKQLPETAPLCHLTIRQMAARWLPDDTPAPIRIFRDTTNFFKIEFGDVVVLNQRPFLIRHNAREGRFGLDDEIKFWVKRSIDLITGEPKLLKLVFHEEFEAHIAGIPFTCYRSPQKEARVLKLVAGRPQFMQGHAVNDQEGNLIRVIDVIPGRSLAAYVDDLRMPHEIYFFEYFPKILDRFIESIDAIRFLHEHGEKHGDIRRDHILIDRERGGIYRWIDFDYTYFHRDNRYGYDLFGLGNILMYLVGKGDILLPALHDAAHPALATLAAEDLNIVFHHRVANLKKIYPYIPEALNRILLHFSQGARRFYEHTGQLLEDLAQYHAVQPACPQAS